MRITDEQIATFKKQGYLIIENFLSKEEQKAALAGFFEWFAPPFDEYVAADRQNNRPKEGVFPWDNDGLNHAVMHPDLIDAAERIIGTREIRLSEGHLGMKYAGGESSEWFHIDYANNTLGPIREPDDYAHVHFFYYFDDVTEGMAPIKMVANGRPDSEAVPMLAPGGSICIYSIYTRHTASQWLVDRGHRPAAWVGYARKDRSYDWSRGFTYKNGANYKGMDRFISGASPRQMEMLGFPAPGDPLWSEDFIQGMVNRYPQFNPAPYRNALKK